MLIENDEWPRFVAGDVVNVRAVVLDDFGGDRVRIEIAPYETAYVKKEAVFVVKPMLAAGDEVQCDDDLYGRVIAVCEPWAVVQPEDGGKPVVWPTSNITPLRTPWPRETTQAAE